jgi:hypothetical protein
MPTHLPFAAGVGGDDGGECRTISMTKWMGTAGVLN